MRASRESFLTMLALCLASSPAPAYAYTFVLSGAFDGGCCSTTVYEELFGKPFELAIDIDPDVVDLDSSPLRGVYPGAILAMSLTVGSDVYRQRTPMGLEIDLGIGFGQRLGPDSVSLLEPSSWDVTLNGLPSDRTFPFEGAFGGPVLLIDDTLTSANLVRSWYHVTMSTQLGMVSGAASATLVPEPSSALLVTLGLTGLATCKRRRADHAEAP